MARFSPQLTRLLVIRGLARAVAPVAVLWGVYDAWLVSPTYGLVLAALTLNYVLVYILTWVAPAALNGPWRIRPWQTFILLINAVLLPILFYRKFDRLPWGFIAITVLFIIGLYVATAIYFHLHARLPMSALFAARKTAGQPSPPVPAGATTGSPAC